MAFCSKCGFEVMDGEKFCETCGSPIRINGGGKAKRRDVFEGTVHKCPACGEHIKSFMSKCPGCGHEFRDVRSSESIKTLALKLEATYSENDKVNLIRTFPIPNTKEDIYEFMFMAVSNYNEKSYVSDENQSSLSSAWYAKIEQCYQKASASFPDSAEFEKIEGLYNKVKQKTEQAASLKELIVALPWLLIVVGFVLFFIDVYAIKSAGSMMIVAGIIIACVRSSRKREKEFAEDPELRQMYEERKARGGFDSWSTGAKIGWVILNIYLIGIPAIIYVKNHKK